MAVDHVCNRIDSVRDLLPNAIDGFELKMLGNGRIFERIVDDMCAGATDGKAPPKFFGDALVPLTIGARYIDVAAWHRPEHNFYSGNAVQHAAAAAASARAATGRAARPARIAPQTVS